MKKGNKITFPGSDFEMEYHAKPEFEHPDDDTWDKTEPDTAYLGERICKWCTIKVPCDECPNRFLTEPKPSPENRFEDFIHGKEKKDV